MSKLNTINNEHLLYENGLLSVEVLGGIRLEGLDRMRATLKMSVKKSPRPPIRHNLDLYNDTQLEKFIRKAAEKLEIGTSVIAGTLSELTQELEEYRIDEIDKQGQHHLFNGKELTKEEKQAAQDFLKSSNLLERTNDLIGKSGIVGEELNRLLMYLIFTSRKRSNPLHVVSLGASGTGKTHLQEKVAELIPEEDKIEITTLSENAFYYFGQHELQHKLILIEDLDGATAVLYPIRELQSKKRISKSIPIKNSKGETRTIHLVVEGPVSVAGCTTHERIYEDNANRSFLLYLDDGEEQDQKIMAYQQLASAGQIDFDSQYKIQEQLKDTQRVLERVNVRNPYANYLHLPKEVLKPRRTNNHYLQFIEAVTFYHQYQREMKADDNGEAYIETTLEDIENANKLLKEVLLRKSDELSGACRNHFEVIKAHLVNEKQDSFTNRSIANQLRIPITTVKRYHLELLNAGYLNLKKKDRLKGYEYEVVSYEDYKKLKESITTVLDKQLEDLKKLEIKPSGSNGSKVAHSQSGLPKKQKIKEKS